MARLLRFSRVVDALNCTVAVAAGWLILDMKAVSTFFVTSREWFRARCNALPGIQWYLFAAVFLLAAGYTLLASEPVRADILDARLPARVRLWVEPASTLLFLFPFTLLAIALLRSCGWCSSAAAWPVGKCHSSIGYGASATLFARIALQPTRRDAP